MSHLGRPRGQKDYKYSFEPIIGEISRILEKKIKFAKDCIGSKTENVVANLNPREILLLENLRFYVEEESGDKEFAAKLARLGDIYINDAFATAHRKHASTAIIAEFFPENKTVGLLMSQELNAIDKILTNGIKPITAIIGGSKVSSKIGIIENILPIIDNLIIGGAMAFTFIKAKGGCIGKSLVENDKQRLALQILRSTAKHNVKVYLPIDIVAAKQFNNDSPIKTVDAYNIPEGWIGLDIGERSIQKFNNVILSSKTILWNGPMGAFEMPNFAYGTIKLGDSIAWATSFLNAFSLVGGGDSVSFAKEYGYDTKVSYISTGGGAMLESLEGKKLPGVIAIKN
ncbi:UNVERIFIED_CONTAM: hypothetical protein PYX00_011008 [Menopon gallinae]|uniref:Phosphoglycerate kinase n=1 Tax=Menopon gallinae TaxID=328185 RepID=A0AAW2H6E3_9NEOP